MTEKQFQTKVIRYLKSLPNTWFFKMWGGGFQRSGIPDLICCINGVFVAIELKEEKGKPTELQKLNIKNINAAGGIGIILYPKGFEEFKKLTEEVLMCNFPTAELSALKSVSTNSNCDIKTN
ncbi:VRR-NUC domain-containing protein [Clostridium sp. USBA 49]|uniref:VRR-NUC domain-containing protein n=1 Tax=Clostridium sp. USBA 49 TaxID=1881060 RepID=UPI00099920A9|nr:VRR-NUC domain-containing protein [Clostridium sp. USBA 49]